MTPVQTQQVLDVLLEARAAQSQIIAVLVLVLFLSLIGMVLQSFLYISMIGQMRACWELLSVMKGVETVAENRRNDAAVTLGRIEKTVALSQNVTNTAAAVAAESVKERLDTATARQDEKLDGIAKVLDATHTLVDGSMTEQKKLLAKAAREKASVTGDAADIEAAEEAEASYHAQAKTHAKEDARALGVRVLEGDPSPPTEEPPT